MIEVTEAGKVIYKTEHNTVGRFPEPGDDGSHERGQSHILTLSLSPPLRGQQIRKTRARPHLQPGGNPLQRHLPAGRQVVVSARNFTASFNFDLSPFFRAV